MNNDLTHTPLITRQRYLEHLEVQHATLGIHTPPYVLLEIEQTKREIERLMHYSFIYTLQREVLESERPTRLPGAILLVSPEEITPDQQALRQAAFAAIDYHRPALRHCWLIATTGERGSLGAAEWLKDYCEARSIAAHVWQVQDASSIAETFDLVRLLYATEVRDSGVPAHQVVADITGATKPMSIGMLLACQGRSPVQYMVRQGNVSMPVLLPPIATDDILPTPSGSE